MDKKVKRVQYRHTDGVIYLVEMSCDSNKTKSKIKLSEFIKGQDKYGKFKIKKSDNAPVGGVDKSEDVYNGFIKLKTLNPDILLKDRGVNGKQSKSDNKEFVAGRISIDKIISHLSDEHGNSFFINLVLKGHKKKIKFDEKVYLFKKKGCECVYCGRKATHFDIVNYEKNKCYIRLMSGDIQMNREHLIPRSLGGDDSLENLEPCCHTCNLQRGNLDLPSIRKIYVRNMRVKNFTVWKWIKSIFCGDCVYLGE